jgi:hypothetical protein
MFSSMLFDSSQGLVINLPIFSFMLAVSYPANLFAIFTILYNSFFKVGLNSSACIY